MTSATTGFPSVHRALSAVQRERLARPPEVDLSNLLQLPQFFWNNWDQFPLGGANGQDLMTEGQVIAGPVDHFASVPQSSRAGEAGWAHDGDGDRSRRTEAGADGVGPNSAMLPSFPTEAVFEPDQSAINNALLRYMLGSHQG